MRIFNRANYILINTIWAISVAIGLLMSISQISTFVHAANTALILAIISVQFYGAYALFKNRYILPIIATAFFLINFNFEGFKFITNTLFFVKSEFANGELAFYGEMLSDPTTLLNLSFRPFNFQMIGVNLYTVFQLAFLIYEYDESMREDEPEMENAT